jgi:LAO/AO transport system kinase
MASLIERVVAGEIRAAARLMRDLDDGIPAARATLRDLFPRTGRAWVVGLTGAPGAGKSSLTDRLVAHYRKAGQTVGVVAIDPTSPFSGGAILGDRIRMQDHATDPAVFIRSLATRGNLGGLSRSTADVVAVLDAMGKDVVIVETVGVGQDEIEVAALAHSVVVVAVPGLGDDVQAIKAGVLEIADVFAVNKADREGADRTVRDLQTMLELRRSTAGRAMSAEDLAHHPGLAPPPPAPERIERDADWEPPIVKTIALRDQGIGELADALASHRAHLEETGGRGAREVARARAGFLAVLKEQLLDAALARLAAEQGSLDELAARIAARDADPYGVAEKIAATLRGA